MKIVFATNNKNKLAEIREILGDKHHVLSLSDIDCHTDIPETGKTLEENAMIKAKYVYDNYGLSVFADDTGLEVYALDGAPGVYSARYAGGEGHDSEANMKKLLHELNGKTNRKARFRTVIAYIIDEQEDYINGESKVNSTAENGGKTAENNSKTIEGTCEGIVEGTITDSKRGVSGFGYDPIFQPEGCAETFAEMGNEQKNKISHRARAVAKFVDFVNSLSDDRQ